MQTQAPARDSFVEDRGGRGKMRVWRWSQDRRIVIRERVNASGGVGYRIVLPRTVTGGRAVLLQNQDFERVKELAQEAVCTAIRAG